MPVRILAPVLVLLIGAEGALACAVAEGCPMGPVFDACAAVRVDGDHVCVNDSAAPGGFRVEARACGAEACVRPEPQGPSLVERVLAALIGR